MRVHNQFKALFLALILAGVATLGASCGGSRTQLAALQPGANSPVVPGPDASALFPGLPELPSGSEDEALPRMASFTDNFLNGSQAFKTASNGVFVNGTGLDLGPVGKNKVTWAMWRWGAFQNGNKPHQLQVDMAITGSNTYWVLLGDYSKNHWQVFGPTKTATASFDCAPGDNYLSPAANVYVAIVTIDTFKFTVNKVNLLCDTDATAPAPPTGVTVPQGTITPHGGLLKWTKPADGDLASYSIYLGTTSDFVDSEPPFLVVADPANVQQPLTGLQSQTQYWVRMKSKDTAGNISVDSNTATFTTKPNGPPVPGFTYSPNDVQKNVDITFDASLTTDPDDALSDLTCSWDWENDGIDDFTQKDATLPAHYSFPNKGPVTVKLTVSDGTASVSTTQAFIVGQQIETRDVGFSTSGEPVNLKFANAEYSSGKMALIAQGGGNPYMKYYDGSINPPTDVDISQFSTYTFDDVLIYSGDIYLTVSQRSGGGSGSDLNWFIYKSSGGAWSLFKSGTISSHPLDYGAKLAFSAAGKFSLGIAAAIVPGFSHNPNTAFYIIHQKADNSLLTYTVYQHDSESNDLVYNVPTPRFSLQRNETTTSCAYTQNFQVAGPGFPDPNTLPRFKVNTAAVTDSGGSQTYLYDATISGGALGGASPMNCFSSKDPADDSKMYWAIYSDEGTVYYGDNFGSANTSSQKFKANPIPTFLLGAGVASDNQCFVYYATADANGLGHMYAYKSQGGVTQDPLPGVGSTAFGCGSWFKSGGNDGMYVIAEEPRDGEVSGRFILNGAVDRTDSLAKPAEALPTGDKTVMFIDRDNGLEVLNRQNVPTAFRHHAAVTGGPFTNSELGFDTWAYPQAGASGTHSGDIVLGSTYGLDTLVLNYFPSGSSVGTYLASYTDAAAYSIAYNSTQNLTGIAYTQAGGKNLVFRTWNGTALSGPTTVYTGASSVIYEVILKARPDGQWGVAWDDGDSNVRMAETSGGTWQAANTLSTGPGTLLHLAAGSIGMEYASNGDAGLAVERSNGTTGLYFGLKPSGSGVANWTLVSASPGFNIKSINVHWMFGNIATVLYYDSSLGVEFAQKNPAWQAVNLAFYLNGSPIVSAIDDVGTLAVAGKDNVTGQAAVCFLSQ